MRALLCILALVASAEARTAARTAKSEVVSDLQVELAVWDANYGRGPIKARLTFKNRGKAPLAVRLDLARVSIDITACGEARTVRLAGASKGDVTIGAGKSVSFDATPGPSMALALHATTTTFVARYEIDEPGTWSGKLATAPLAIAVKHGSKCPTKS